MPHYLKLRTIAFLASVLFFSCAPPTTMTRSWSDPSIANGSFKPFTKVLVIARFKDVTTQHIAEDRIVAEFKPGVGFPSYSYMTESDTTDRILFSRLKRDGFDGLIHMRLSDVTQSVNVQNNGGYYGRYGYYNSGYNNTTVSVDKTYYVETTIYDINANKLLWSGTTSTFDPGSFSQTLDQIISVNKAEMVKKGIIKPTNPTY